MTTQKTFSDFGIELRSNSGEEDTTCPQCSDTRKNKRARCLSVNIDKGVWTCHHCGWSGGLGTGEQHRPTIVKTWRKPVYEINRTSLSDGAVKWFASRGITQEVLIRNRVAVCSVYFPQLEDRANAVAFPYQRGNEVVNVKYRTQDKHFRMEAGAERVLYGLNDIGDTLIWVEGEMDKLSVEVAGYVSCVSVPDGAPTPNTKNYDSKFDFMAAPELDKAKTHIIAVDNDEPGVRLEEELLRRLGRDQCKVVRWSEGCKDANDVLKRHGAAILKECIEAASWVPVEGEHSVSEYRESMERLYRYGMPKGHSTGWECVDELYTVMPGEWTLVTGIPGHGKSEWLDALMIHLARLHGWNFAVFSPENQPTEYHLSKLAEKHVGKPFSQGPTARMSQREKDGAISFLDEHFTFLMPELPSVDGLIERLKSIVKRHGVRGVVLDPWNEIDHSRLAGLSETEYISQALSKLRAFTRAHGVHLWIIAHPTKLQKEANGQYPVPTPYDVAGSAHWRNKADNCIAVWRDITKQTSTVEIHVQKIRKKSVGRVGVVELAYDRLTGQYRAPFSAPHSAQPDWENDEIPD
ncbi:bifunctional DNA primase/helicase [Comamonas squillarum]|uniref:Toprim domain-containing protein n=1 Tax=Comamonas squillarum TaxID=2977320 RepID=A0ABY6A1F5_9BURK|nr:bifunctional DNA primase/helicase [Comamonas sp. PR12]UXC18539.1 toprim domain-containing protein [Comamonas sp. PR12]